MQDSSSTFLLHFYSPFRIVVGHKPAYSSNTGHGSDLNLRNTVTNLFHETQVDLVLGGHGKFIFGSFIEFSDHSYERSFPVANVIMEHLHSLT